MAMDEPEVARQVLVTAAKRCPRSVAIVTKRRRKVAALLHGTGIARGPGTLYPRDGYFERLRAVSPMVATWLLAHPHS